MKGINESAVPTIIGHTEEISIEEDESTCQVNPKRHPEMKSFGLDIFTSQQI